MNRIPYRPKKKLIGGGFSWGSGQGQGMASAGAGILGTAGDLFNANSEEPSMAGSILGGAGKGAAAGMAFGPLGAAIGGAAGLVGGIINGKQQQEDFELAEEKRFATDKSIAINNSAAIQANYDNDGTGLQSFEGGGMINYPYQSQDKGIAIDPTLQLQYGEYAEGGDLKPISNTAQEVVGDNPNATDGVELESAFVNHGETIENNKVYTDEFGLNGKKATKKNPSFADLHKKLQKQKTGEKNFEAFDAFIDNKSEKLFATQEALKGEDNEPVMMAAKGGYIDGGNTDPLNEKRLALEEKGAAFNRTPSNPEEWAIEMELRKGEQSPEEMAYRAENAKIQAKDILFEQARKANPQFEGGPEATEAKPYMTYKTNPKAINNWYKENVFNSKVQGKELTEILGKAASKLGLDPTELTAAAIQEGAVGEKLNRELNSEIGNIDSYGFGLDTVGDYKDVIEKKLGKDALKGVNLPYNENEKKQSIQYGEFKDSQQMYDAFAAVYQHRAEAVGQTAKDLGIELSPWVKQYFNYIGYNTQHNTNNPVIRGEPNAKDSYNRTLKKIMSGFKNDKTGNKLDLSKKEFDEYVKTTRKGGTNPYGDPDTGLGQNFKNAGDAYQRIAALEGVYEEDIPFYVKAPEKEKINSIPELNAGGYTDMNTLSAEYMKANLTKRKGKKKGYAGGGQYLPGAIPGAAKAARYSQGQPTGSEGDKSLRTSQMAVGADPIMNNVPPAFMGADPELLNSIQGDFDQSIANPINREQEALNVPLATGEATPDMSTQLALGALVTAPLSAGASLAKKAIGTFNHAGQSASTGSIGGNINTASNLGHTAEGIAKQTNKGINTNTYAELGYKKGGKLNYEGGGITPGPINERSMSTMKNTITKRRKPKYADGGTTLGDMNYEVGATRFNPGPQVKGLGLQDASPMGSFTPGSPTNALATKIGQNGRATTPTSVKEGFNYQGVADMIGGYGADIAGLATRLPETPQARMLDLTTLERIDNKEQLDVINREARGLDRSIAENTAQAGNASSSRGNVLAKKLAAQNASFDRVDKTNTAIQNQEASIQAQQKATNLASGTQQDYNEQSKQIAEKRIRRESLTNMADRYNFSRSEDKQRDLDLQKTQLTKEMFAGKGIDDRTMALLKESYPELYKDLGGRKYGGLMKKKKKRAMA